MKGEERAREMKNGDRKKTNEWNAVPERERPPWTAAKQHQQLGVGGKTGQMSEFTTNNDDVSMVQTSSHWG